MRTVQCKVCSTDIHRTAASRTALCSDRCRAEKARQHMKAWRQAQPTEDLAGKAREWDLANKDRVRANHYRSRYGVTTSDLDAMLLSQNFKCPICTEPLTFNGTKGRDLPVVDHCHSSKNVRGLLCTPCNLALGYLKDSPDNGRRLVQYLEDNGH